MRPDKIHSTLYEKNKLYYLCTKAVIPNIKKMTHDKSKVNCKNCLRLLEKIKYFGDDNKWTTNMIND